MKKFTVIIPCHNAADYIEVCMEHIFHQTIGFENIEVILIDDVSSDDGRTLSLLHKFEQAYPDNIILIPCTEKHGPGGCRNLALPYAGGEYIAYCDADDWYDYDAFEILYHAAKSTDSDVVEYGHSKVYSFDGMCTHDHSAYYTEETGSHGLPKHNSEDVCSHSRPKHNAEDVCSQDISTSDKSFIPDNSANTQLQDHKSSNLTLIDTVEKRKQFVLPSDSTMVCWDKIYRRELLQDNHILFHEITPYEEPPFSLLVRFYARKYCTLSLSLYYYYQRPGSNSRTFFQRRYDMMTAYNTFFESCQTHGLYEQYWQEIDYLYWCGYFYMPLFNMASKEQFYNTEELIHLQKHLQQRIHDIRKNPHFCDAFHDLPVLGELTYADLSKLELSDIYDLFFRLSHG